MSSQPYSCCRVKNYLGPLPFLQALKKKRPYLFQKCRGSLLSSYSILIIQEEGKKRKGVSMVTLTSNPYNTHRFIPLPKNVHSYSIIPAYNPLASKLKPNTHTTPSSTSTVKVCMHHHQTKKILNEQRKFIERTSFSKKKDRFGGCCQGTTICKITCLIDQYSEE